MLRPSGTAGIPEQGGRAARPRREAHRTRLAGAEIVGRRAPRTRDGWPAAPLSPLAAIGSALVGSEASTEVTSRKTDETISLEQALDAFTRVPAFASFDEQRKGSLKPGMLADLVVLSATSSRPHPRDLLHDRSRDDLRRQDRLPAKRLTHRLGTSVREGCPRRRSRRQWSDPWT